MSEDASIDTYMLTFCVKYWLKHINEFTIDEITRERDPELTGLGKKARGVSDVRTDILPLLKKEELIEMISEQKFRLTGEGLNYCASKMREKCLA
jgi:hypothetical protein